MLYGSEVWGPQTNQDLISCCVPTDSKSYLGVHRNTVSNARRAELSQCPIIINIQKQAIKFNKHLQSSDPHSYQYKALQCQESNKDQESSLWTQIPGITDNPQYINKKKSIT